MAKKGLSHVVTVPAPRHMETAVAAKYHRLLAVAAASKPQCSLQTPDCLAETCQLQ